MRQFFKTLNIIYERSLLAVFVCILLIVIYSIYDIWYIYDYAGDNSILKYKPSAYSVDAGASPITEDMVAWLTINDTNIDYPIMQSDDNTKYLNTDPFGNYSLSGSIFLDSRNASDFTDRYSLLYGHHMEYGKMFGALDDFLDPDYLNAHSDGTLIIGRNAEKTYKLKVFASMMVSAKEDRVFSPEKSAGLNAYIKQSAKVFAGEQNKRILGLSTCTEADSVTRVVVFCYILDE